MMWSKGEYDVQQPNVLDVPAPCLADSWIGSAGSAEPNIASMFLFFTTN